MDIAFDDEDANMQQLGHLDVRKQVATHDVICLRQCIRLAKLGA